MAENWGRNSDLRVSRRKILAASLAGGAGVVSFGTFGCGDDDSTAAPGANASARAAATETPKAAVETPKKGGSWSTLVNADRPNLDPFNNAVVQTQANHTYSRLFTIESTVPDKSGVVPAKIVPDAAESYEVSADGKTYTIKLKGNVKYHPPLNRALDAEDVVFSWKRFTGRISGTTPSPNANLLAIIDDVRAVDARTVVFSLNKPYGPFPNLLADGSALLLMPKETGTAFDPAKAMLGSGPWMFKEYVPGSSLKWVRNPQWHFGPDRPYMDELTHFIIPDRNNALNQFKAGKVDTVAINGLDVADLTAAVNGVQVNVTAGNLTGWYAFSSVTETTNRWSDVRVRRAMSMALDRDTIESAAYSLDLFRKAGFAFEVPWQGILPVSLGAVALQPQKIDSVAQYFKYDPKAAKALLDQTGGGFSVDVYDPAGSAYGPEHDTLTLLALKYWDAIGIKATLKPVDYRSEWIPNIYQGKNFAGNKGLAHAGQAGLSEPGVFIQSAWSPGAPINQSKSNDSKVNPALDSYFAELDEKKRIKILQDLQLYLMEQMYYVPSGWGAFPTIVALQANIRGYKDHLSLGYGAQGQDLTYYWKA